MSKVKIILGSTREGRVGDKIANWVLQNAKKRKEFETELIDLRDWKLPFLTSSILPSMVKDSKDYSDSIIQKWSEEIKFADGFIIVTPEYNHSCPAVLKNALDHLYSEWNGKPVAFVGYGYSANGARSIVHLRDVVAELQMLQTRNEMDIFLPSVLNQKGEFNAINLEQKLGTVFDQLASFLKMAGR